MLLISVDSLGFTPFMNCAIGGEKELCELLAERGADPVSKSNDGGISLHYAAQKNCFDVCRYLVEDCGLDINAESKDEKGRPRTPLFLAAMHGNKEVCRYLLAKGAKVDAGRQPLFAAAEVQFILISQNGHSNIVQLLLDHGANPLLKDSDGDSAMTMCSSKGHVDIMELLYKYGARDELLYRPDEAV
jgi:ankyrin repeat protein